MIAIGNTIALNHGDKLARLYSETWKDSLDGELKEINFNKKEIEKDNKKTSIKSKLFKEYNRIIDKKTASIFSAACKAGALEANATDEVSEILAKYGREVGLAYQLADDLVDLLNGEMIGSVVIPLLSKLENKKVDTTSLDEDSILEILNKNKTKIEKIFVKEIIKHLDKAEELISSENIPESQYKNLLILAPRHIINNMLKEIKLKV